MQMSAVTSHDLAYVGYENRVLRITFRHGGTYEYSNVPEAVYNGLMAAVSHGKYFHEYIKDVYPYRRIG